MEFMSNPFDERIEELFNEHAEDLDPFGLEREADRIAHESYPGFIPYTNGGWSLLVMNTLDHIWGSGECVNAMVQPELDRAIDYSLEIAQESFIEENRGKLAELYDTDDDEKLKEVVNYHSLYDKDEGTLAEELSEAETTCLSEGGDFYFVMRAAYFKADNLRNESGEDEIFFYGGINTDYGYGRDSGLVSTFERTIKVSDLDNDKLVEIIQTMRDSLAEK